jgi:hypothetical protein
MNVAAPRAVKRRLRPAALFAWVIVATCIVLTIAGVALFISNRSASLPTAFGTRDTAYINAVVFLVMPLVGALVVTKDEAYPLGWLFCLIGLLMSLWAALDAYAVRALLVSPELPGGHIAGWVAGWTWIPGWCLAGFVFLLFPTGQVLWPAMRWVGWIFGITAALAMLNYMLTPGDLRDFEGIGSPFGIGGHPLDNWQAGVVAVVALAISGAPCVASLFVRLRRSRGVQRQQIKWLVWASGLMLAIIGVWVVLAPLGFRERGLEAVSSLAAAGIPIAAGIAVLRYRLWDIDLIINRTIVYGILTTLLGVVYVGSIVSLQRVLEPWTSGSNLAISASTLAVAAMFRPALQRVQIGVDYRFYRRRYDAQRTIEEFRARVQSQTNLEEVRTELLGVVHATMQPEFIDVWIRPNVVADDSN